MPNFQCKLCDKKFETSVCLENHTSQKKPCAFICNLCGLNYKSKQALEKHLNKKIKCNTITKYQCSKCHKYFTQKHSLVEHASVPCKKYTPIDLVPEPNVKIKLSGNEPDIMDMEFILNQNIPTSCKIELLLIRYKKITLSKEAIKSIIDCSTMDMKLKINYLKASEENDINNFDNIIEINNIYVQYSNTSKIILNNFFKLIITIIKLIIYTIIIEISCISTYLDNYF
jgi:hypothetical protein